jgi:hypothetical protein
MEADEVLDAYVKKMGLQLGQIFHAVSHELTWVHWRWSQYRILFGEKPSRIELLNECAPFFFRVVQDVLFEDTLLGITRLIGPPQSLNKPNLTIQRFPPLCDAKIRHEITKLVAEARTAAAFAVDWRNRHLAHRDLDLALGKPARILEVATREKVETALTALRDVLNSIEHEYCESVTAYFSPTPWGAESLLHILRDGLLREKDRRVRWNRGELHDDDINPLEPI